MKKENEIYKSARKRYQKIFRKKVAKDRLKTGAWVYISPFRKYMINLQPYNLN